MSPRQKQQRNHDQKFGEYIRKLRLERFPYHSGRVFAKEVGMTGPYLSNIERGIFPPPSPDKVIALAEKLGVDRQELLSMAGHADPEFIHAFREAPKAMWQMAQLLNNLLKGTDVDLSFQDIIELFIGKSVEKGRTLNRREEIQMMIAVMKHSEPGDSLPDDMKALIEKGREFIANNLPGEGSAKSPSRGSRSRSRDIDSED